MGASFSVVSMGFSAAEARLSLRACAGDVTLAVEHITRKRQVSGRVSCQARSGGKHEQAEMSRLLITLINF